MVRLINQPLGRYWKSTWIKEKFDIKSATFTKVRNLIRQHPERYSYYAIDGRNTDVCAFFDAKVFAKKLINGSDLPPYDPEAIAKMIGVLHER